MFKIVASALTTGVVALSSSAQSGETWGGGETYPKEAHHCQKGDVIVLDGRPVKIADIRTAKTGKHGHAKVAIQGEDIFDGSRHSTVAPSHEAFQAVNVTKRTETITASGAETVTLADGSEVEVARGKHGECELRTNLMEAVEEQADKGDGINVEVVITSALGKTLVTGFNS